MNYSILNKKLIFNKEYDWGMLRLNMCEKVIDKKYMYIIFINMWINLKV